MCASAFYALVPSGVRLPFCILTLPLVLSPALPFDLAGELWTMKKFLKTKKTREAIAACPSLTADGAGAIYLFTCESPLYRELNAKLRARDRAALKVRS